MMNRHPSDCRCCSGPAAEVEQQAEVIELPAEPRQIRVHAPGVRPLDCTLHPDGLLTRVVNGELCRNFMSFADMRERDWRHARVEFDPGPLAVEPESAAEAVQEAVAL